MKVLFDITVLDTHKSRQAFPLECEVCKKSFYRTKSQIQAVIKGKTHNKLQFCSLSCAAKYNNKHKIHHGNPRCKLEIWLEIKLKELYPNLPIIYNDRIEMNGMELDIYIPSFRLAFELNGPYHYEPIYGIERLNKAQINDKRKIILCAEKGIEICVIDTSKQNYFKEKSSQEFLDIITNIIDNRLKNDGGGSFAALPRESIN